MESHSGCLDHHLLCKSEKIVRIRLRVEAALLKTNKKYSRSLEHAVLTCVQIRTLRVVVVVVLGGDYA